MFGFGKHREPRSELDERGNWHRGKSDREILEALVETAVILLDRTEIMATLADVQAAQSALDSSISSAASRVLAALGAGGTGGGAASAADLDSVVSALNNSKSNVDAIAPSGSASGGNSGQVPEVDSLGNPILDANGIQLMGVPVLDDNGNAVLDSAGNPTYSTVNPAGATTLSGLGSVTDFGPMNEDSSLPLSHSEAVARAIDTGQPIPNAPVQAPDVIQKLP